MELGPPAGHSRRRRPLRHPRPRLPPRPRPAALRQALVEVGVQVALLLGAARLVGCRSSSTRPCSSRSVACTSSWCSSEAHLVGIAALEARDARLRSLTVQLRRIIFGRRVAQPAKQGQHHKRGSTAGIRGLRALGLGSARAALLGYTISTRAVLRHEVSSWPETAGRSSP